jgi:holo-[acyl-carrier protein] synthase
MILGLGIDVVEIDRIARSWERFGRAFAERILTRRELDGLPAAPARYLAARFAAKEAAVKALGCGFRLGVTFRSIEVRSLDSGQPELALLDRAADIGRELGAARTLVSLTHGRDVAVAVVVIEGEPGHG